MSWLKTFGNDVKKVFGWLGSPKGQTLLGIAESGAEAVDPGLVGVVNIANSWLQEIFKAQALASAASAGVNSGTQKAAMVLSTMTPQILNFVNAQKIPMPDEAQIQKANDSLVAFLDALGETDPTATSTAVKATASVGSASVSNQAATGTLL